MDVTCRFSTYCKGRAELIYAGIKSNIFINNILIDKRRNHNYNLQNLIYMYDAFFFSDNTVCQDNIFVKIIFLMYVFLYYSNPKNS